MALQWHDRVMETSTTTGTGDFTLAGAVTGFKTFASRMATNDTCYYSITAVDAGGTPTGEWETGLGTYSASNTLTRTTVQHSSNSDAAVNFSAGTKRVSIQVVSQAMKFRGAKVTMASDATAQNYTTQAAIPFDTEYWDTDSIHNTVTNNSRLSVPSGVTYVHIRAHVELVNVTTDTASQIFFRKNGSSLDFDGAARDYENESSTARYMSLDGGICAVVGGTDYFEVMLLQATDTSIDIDASRTWFEMRIIA